MSDDVSTIPNIRPEEVERFHAAGVRTTRELWERLGRDAEHGHDQLAKAVKISPRRLLDLLQRLTLYEAAHCAGPWLIRHTADVLVAFMGVAIVVLVIRAIDRLPWLGNAWAITPNVQVAARSIARGEVIRAEDVTVASLPFQRPYFTDAAALIGTIADRPLGRLQPFRVIDVLRAQAVATKDLPPGTRVPRDAIALSWTPYDGRALLSVDDAIGRKTAVAVRQGQVLILALLEASP